MTFEQRMEHDKARVEAALARAFQGRTPHADLYDAMNYSLLAGGKRIRPILVLESCRLCGGDPELAMPFACAIEMVHTYSLIHDDLPCMDDDDLRRGRPTNHVKFGEATAVLAGDALLTAAFETALGAEGLPNDRVLECARSLAAAAGAAGMVGGQALDIDGEGRALTRPDVEELQSLKTGALLAAACDMGCVAAGGSEADREALGTYARKLGLAFQVRDDMLDVIADVDSLGKSVGKDARDGKTTFVSLLGLEGCAALADRLTEEAVNALSRFEDPDFLTRLARALVDRTH